MRIFDWYVFRNLASATLFIGLTLIAVIFLTQSLRFLELVINSGASSSTFWVLTFLALPRFFEVILPIALMAATVFIYNRMTMDSELIVARSVGYSPMVLARPALILSLMVTVFLWAMTMWIAPKALSSMQELSHTIKTQFSTLLFREGVFNQVGPGLTVYVRQRGEENELQGMMIYDNREKAKNPTIIMAKRGVIVAKGEGHQVVAYDGFRHEYDRKADTLHRLNFDRYTIDLPSAGPVRTRWREPDERTLYELLHPDLENPRDVESLHSFKMEVHRRIINPLLSIVFALISCCALLIGPVGRHGQSYKIAIAIGSVIIIQGLSLAGFNMARQTDWALAFVYLLIFLPLGAALFLLSGAGDRIRRKILYSQTDGAMEAS